MSDTIPYIRLIYLLPPLLVSGFLYWRWCGVKFEMGYAVLRMVAQLILIGYLLVFFFENDSSWTGLAILGVMVTMSTFIAVRPLRGLHAPCFSRSLVAIALSGTVTLGLVLVGVLDLSPVYQPKVAIPLAGMIYSNAMNTISLAGERYFNERKHGSVIHARGIAYKAALIPQINSFFAVGLVSLPGMMTGQILSGVSPLIAVRYQLMVMAMIMGSAGLSAGIFLFLSTRGEIEKNTSK